MYSIDRESMDKYHIDLAGVVREALKDNQTAILDRQKLATTEKIGLPVAQLQGVRMAVKTKVESCSCGISTPASDCAQRQSQTIIRSFICCWASA